MGWLGLTHIHRALRAVFFFLGWGPPAPRTGARPPTAAALPPPVPPLVGPLFRIPAVSLSLLAILCQCGTCGLAPDTRLATLCVLCYCVCRPSDMVGSMAGVRWHRGKICRGSLLLLVRSPCLPPPDWEPWREPGAVMCQTRRLRAGVPFPTCVCPRPTSGPRSLRTPMSQSPVLADGRRWYPPALLGRPATVLPWCPWGA